MWGVSVSLRDVRRGRVAGGARNRHRSPTRASRDSQLVRKSVGSPRFRACWATRTTSLGELGPLWGTQLIQRVSGSTLTLLWQGQSRLRVSGPDLGLGVRPKARGRVTYPGVFVTDASPRSRLRDRPITQPFAVERKWLYAPLSLHSRRNHRPDRGGSVTEVRLRDVPAPAITRTPHVLGVSWRSQPARTAMRRPGATRTAAPAGTTPPAAPAEPPPPPLPPRPLHAGASHATMGR